MAEQVSIDILINNAQAATSVRELRQGILALRGAALQAGEGTADFARIAAGIANANDRMNDLNDSVRALDPGAKGKAFAQLGQSVAGSLGVATGALGIFGTKNEELNEIINKVNASIVLLGSIEQAQNVVRDLGIIRGIALRGTETAAVAATTTAIEGQAVATTQLTVAQRIFNGVMAASPIFLLVTVVTSIVEGYLLQNKAQDDLTEAIIQTNVELERENQIATILYDDKINQLEAELEIFKINNSTKTNLNDNYYSELARKEEEIYNAKDDFLLAEIESNKTQIKNLETLQKTASNKEKEELAKKINELNLNNARYIADRSKLANQADVNDAKFSADEIKRNQEKTKKLLEDQKRLYDEKLKYSQLLNDVEASELKLNQIERTKEFLNVQIAYNKAIQEQTDLQSGGSIEETLLFNLKKNKINEERQLILETIKLEKSKSDLKIQTLQDELKLNITDIRKKQIQEELTIVENGAKATSETITLYDLKTTNELIENFNKYKDNILKNDSELDKELKNNSLTIEKLNDIINTDRIQKLEQRNAKILQLEFTNREKNLELDKQISDKRIEYNKAIDEKRVKDYTRLNLEIIELTKIRGNEIKKIEDQYRQKQLEDNKIYLILLNGLYKEYNEKEILQLDKSLEGQRNLKKINNKENYDILLTNLNTEKDLLIQNGKDVTEINKKIQDTQLNLNKANLVLELEYWAAKGQIAVDYANRVNSVLSGIAANQNQNFENELNDRQKISDDAFNRQIDAAEKAYQSELAIAKINGTGVEEIEKRKSDAVAQANFDKQKAEFETAKRANVLAEQQFKLNKSLQIVQAVINTASGVTGALAQTAVLGPIGAGIAAGITAAAGAAQIAAIAKTKFVPNNIGPAPQKPSQLNYQGINNGNNDTGNNGLAQTGVEFQTEQLLTAGRQAQQGAMRVYVLESDITSTQQRVRVIESNNTIG